MLCPVDFSEASRAALREALRVARQFNAELHVLFVADPLLAVAATDDGAPSMLEGDLRDFVAATANVDEAVQPRLHIAAGRAAEEIIRVAAREHIDAIVMGAYGGAGVRTAFFGSTTARVLRRTRLPLLVVPASADPDRGRDLAGLGSILVLTDFGGAAGCAAGAAASLAAKVGARLTLVHVLPPVSAPPSWTSPAAAVMDSCATEAHRRMPGAMAPLETFGPVESVIRQGNIAATVAELARAHHVGLIVIGLDAEPDGARPGSTAYGVIAAAPVPVLVIPAGRTS